MANQELIGDYEETKEQSIIMPTKPEEVKQGNLDATMRAPDLNLTPLPEAKELQEKQSQKRELDRQRHDLKDAYEEAKKDLTSFQEQHAY